MGEQTYTLVTGDCVEAMRAMQDASVDAVVTDPPYELGFMGKRWDRSGVAFDPATWAECLRVLKDGGRMLAFGGSRTHHRIWCAIEDAGFVIEDTMMWLYGSGFPKHRSKLKPAYEPICVARKGGVGELNIDECRLSVGFTGNREGGDPSGRWPANVLLDEEAAALLDEQSGVLTSGFMGAGTRREGIGYHGGLGNTVRNDTHGDSGGASRFFYVAKASRSERDSGLSDMPLRACGTMEDNGYAWPREVERGRKPRSTMRHNHHPTVKPVDLMRYLVRLVAREGQTVLDPFMGSGTTGIATLQEGRRFIGIEMNPEYADIARRRIESTPLNLFGAA